MPCKDIVPTSFDREGLMAKTLRIVNLSDYFGNGNSYDKPIGVVILTDVRHLR